MFVEDVKEFDPMLHKMLDVEHNAWQTRAWTFNNLIFHAHWMINEMEGELYSVLPEDFPEREKYDDWMDEIGFSLWSRVNGEELAWELARSITRYNYRYDNPDEIPWKEYSTRTKAIAKWLWSLVTKKRIKRISDRYWDICI